MQRERAVELAYINGHAANAVSKADWEQAKRELKSETEKDPKEALLEAAPESERDIKRLKLRRKMKMRKAALKPNNSPMRALMRRPGIKRSRLPSPPIKQIETARENHGRIRWPRRNDAVEPPLLLPKCIH